MLLPTALLLVAYSFINRFINICIFFIKIFCFNSFINPPFFYFCDQRNTFIHCNGKWLCTAHAAKTGSYVECAFERCRASCEPWSVNGLPTDLVDCELKCLSATAA